MQRRSWPNMNADKNYQGSALTGCLLTEQILMLLYLPAVDIESQISSSERANCCIDSDNLILKCFNHASPKSWRKVYEVSTQSRKCKLGLLNTNANVNMSSRRYSRTLAISHLFLFMYTPRALNFSIDSIHVTFRQVPSMQQQFAISVQWMPLLSDFGPAKGKTDWCVRRHRSCRSRSQACSFNWRWQIRVPCKDRQLFKTRGPCIRSRTKRGEVNGGVYLTHPYIIALTEFEKGATELISTQAWNGSTPSETIMRKGETKVADRVR